MGFSALLFYGYLFIVPVGLVGLGAWLMRYLTQLNFAQEKRILFVVIALACLAFVATFIGMRLYENTLPALPPTPDEKAAAPATPAIIGQVQTKPETPLSTEIAPWSVAPQPTQSAPVQQPPPKPARPLTEEERLQLFEMEHYPDLHEQRVALLREIREQEAFFNNINALARRVPKHRQLLEAIYKLRQQAYQNLRQQNDEVGRYQREFWVHYNTGNSHDAMTKFNPIAARLTKQIKQSRAALLEVDRQEEKLLSNHMRKAGAALKVSKIPKELAGKITAYSPNNRQLLRQWLETHGPQRSLQLLDRLREQRAIIRERISKLNYFKQRYTDLVSKLNRTLQLWRQAEEANYYADYRVLYAVEARYIVDTLNLTSSQAPAKRLFDELNAYTEMVGGQAEDALEKAEQAYRPPNLR